MKRVVVPPGSYSASALASEIKKAAASEGFFEVAGSLRCDLPEVDLSLLATHEGRTPGDKSSFWAPELAVAFVLGFALGAFVAPLLFAMLKVPAL